MGAAAAIGAGLSLFGAHQARQAQEQAMRPQRNIAKEQLGLFRQASPYYNQILQYLAGNAGLTMPGAPSPVPGAPSPVPGGTAPQAPATPARATIGFGGSGRLPAAGGVATPAAPGQPAPALGMGMGSIPQSALGIYGTNPADQYRFAQAEDEIGRLRQRRAQQLQYQLGQQGAGTNTTAAALGRNEEDALRQLTEFRRNLAINAGSEQERRVGALLGALSPGFGQGQAAAGIFGQQAAQAGSQLGQASAGIGDALQNYMLWRALQKQQKQPAVDPMAQYGQDILYGNFWKGF